MHALINDSTTTELFVDSVLFEGTIYMFILIHVVNSADISRYKSHELHVDVVLSVL
jgi:hypothetical protein